MELRWIMILTAFVIFYINFASFFHGSCGAGEGAWADVPRGGVLSGGHPQPHQLLLRGQEGG